MNAARLIVIDGRDGRTERTERAVNALQCWISVWQIVMYLGDFVTD